MSQENNFENLHWADYTAQKVIERFPKEDIYTVASGITPSGIIHVGHFREILTSELVRKSLENKGKKTRFIYSWDSYDSFRKVPKNIPEEFEQYLRLPDSQVPDPWEEYESYAERYMQKAEADFESFNFPIEYQRQHLIQTSGEYAEDIKACLQKKDTIREMINKYRQDNPLPNDWMPLSVYARDTGKDTTKITHYDGQYTITYKNKETEFVETINFKETPIVKLSWRLDWPMRWAHFGVTFEPGGKDHSTPGGSYDTGCDIVREVFNREPPQYAIYNNVKMKGQGGKISSSSGNGATVSDVLKIYSPQMVLYMFASTRPNAEMDLSFDMDVIKIYEDFDKLERLYYGLEEEKNAKKKATLLRTYELSVPNNEVIPKQCPIQPSMRHMCTIAQAQDFNYEKVKSFFKDQIKTQFDEKRVEQRFYCAKHWLGLYAPEEMKFSLVSKIENISEEQRQILKEVKDALKNKENPKELFGDFKIIAQNHNLEISEFFTMMYQVLMNKDKGPKLGGFMIENKEKMLNLLEEL